MSLRQLQGLHRFNATDEGGYDGGCSRLTFDVKVVEPLANASANTRSQKEHECE